jgi:hypothetical protein
VKPGPKTVQSVTQGTDRVIGREKGGGSVVDGGGSQCLLGRTEVEVYVRDARAGWVVRSTTALARGDVGAPLYRLHGLRRDGSCNTSSLPFWKLSKKYVDE